MLSALFFCTNKVTWPLWNRVPPKDAYIIWKVMASFGSSTSMMLIRGAGAGAWLWWPPPPPGPPPPGWWWGWKPPRVGAALGGGRGGPRGIWKIRQSRFDKIYANAYRCLFKISHNQMCTKLRHEASKNTVDLKMKRGELLPLTSMETKIEFYARSYILSNYTFNVHVKKPPVITFR